MKEISEVIAFIIIGTLTVYSFIQIVKLVIKFIKGFKVAKLNKPDKYACRQSDLVSYSGDFASVKKAREIIKIGLKYESNKSCIQAMELGCVQLIIDGDRYMMDRDLYNKINSLLLEHLQNDNKLIEKELKTTTIVKELFQPEIVHTESGHEIIKK